MSCGCESKNYESDSSPDVSPVASSPGGGSLGGLVNLYDSQDNVISYDSDNQDKTETKKAGLFPWLLIGGLAWYIYG